MKAVMLSIQPKWCELIASGEKTIEVRKTHPKIETPFKCYIYCTQSELLTKSHHTGDIYVASKKKYRQALERNGNITLSGKVIGEFVCDETVEDIHGENATLFEAHGCLPFEQQKKYSPKKPLYGWHISDLVIYDKPKEVGEFKMCNTYKGKWNKDGTRSTQITRPPQSWCYVEENGSY